MTVAHGNRTKQEHREHKSIQINTINHHQNLKCEKI